MVPGSGGASGMMPGGGSDLAPDSEAQSGMMPTDRPPTEGDMLYFFCHPGYKLIGSPSLTCSCDGTWDGLPPMCKEIMKPTKMPDYTRPFAEFTTLDIIEQESTTSEPFEGTKPHLQEATTLSEMEFSTTTPVNEVTEDSSKPPKVETDEPNAPTTKPAVRPSDPTTSPQPELKSTTQPSDPPTSPKPELKSTTQPRDPTTSPQPELKSTAQPTIPTTSPQPELKSTAQPTIPTTTPQQQSQTSPSLQNPSTAPQGESRSTASVETTQNDPCSSNPCAEKANSECVNTGQGSFVCSCLPQFFESNGQCESSRSFSGTLRVTQIGSRQAEFSEDMQDPSSETFKSMAASMETTIDSIYLASTPTIAERYLGSTVLGFKNGSIVVDYVAHLNNSRNETINDPAVVESAFEQAYMTSTTTGSLNITVDVAASTVTGK
jgi:hypothetical protein